MTREELRDKVVMDTNRLLSHKYILRIDSETEALIEAQKQLVQTDPQTVEKLYNLLPPDMRS